MRSAHLSATWLAILVACAPAQEVALDLPPTTGARAMILASEIDGELALRAATVDDRVHLDITVPAGAKIVRLEALMFDESVEDLGVREGPLPMLSAGSRVPAADEVYRFELGSDTAWQRATAISEALDAVRIEIAARSVCADFDSEAYTLETAHNSAFAFTLGDDTAMVGTLDGQMFLVDATGGSRKITSTVGAYAGFKDADGRVWGGTYTGELWRGRLAGDALVRELISQGLDRSIVRRLDGRASGSSAEVYALTQEGLFERFDGTAWTMIARLPVPPPPERWDGSVLWLAPGEALAITSSQRAVVRVRAGVVTEETLDIESAPTILGFVPGVGPLVGTTWGQVLAERGDGGWRELGQSELRLWVMGIAPYEDGFLYCGAFGNLGQYKPGHGHCALRRVAAHSLLHMVPIGRDGLDLLVFGENPATERTPFAVVRRRR